MRDFTQDERNLMMLGEDEEELCTLVDTVLSKLSDIDEAAFDRLNLYPDF